LVEASERRLTLALDQNFPEPILRCLDEFLVDVHLVPLRQIDARLPELPDRQLLLVLDALGLAGLVTNNHKMMQNPAEIAGLLRTTLTLFVVEGVGHDPIRATGAVLLDLPGALRRLEPSKPQVFWSRPRNPEPALPWTLFERAAERAHRSADELYAELKVSDEEWRDARRGTVDHDPA
jgi:hypothetical protein